MFNILYRTLGKLNLYYSVCTHTPQQLALSYLVGSRDLRSNSGFVYRHLSLSKPSHWPGKFKYSPVGRGRIHIQAAD